MGKKRLTKRIIELEARMNLRMRAERELNQRIDNLVELVTSLDNQLDVIRDKRDKSEGK